MKKSWSIFLDIKHKTLKVFSRSAYWATFEWISNLNSLAQILFLHGLSSGWLRHLVFICPTCGFDSVWNKSCSSSPLHVTQRAFYNHCLPLTINSSREYSPLSSLLYISVIMQFMIFDICVLLLWLLLNTRNHVIIWLNNPWGRIDDHDVQKRMKTSSSTPAPLVRFQL